MELWRRIVHHLERPDLGKSYEWTRYAILRLLGLVYLVAFAGAWFQLPGLMGEQGITPMGPYLEGIDAYFYDSGERRLPSLFWYGHSTAALRAVSLVGVALSLVVLAGGSNAVVMLVLWGLYLSIVNVGGRWYSFGWETQLLETGLISVFLCPLRSLRPFDARHRSPIIVIWLYRWLAFRIMLGSGLIKWRGDPCWRDYTCLDYHFETQPIPGPFSSLFHHLPEGMLHLGVGFNHVAELLLPFLIFGPRRLRHAAGFGLVAFQITLILSGNLAFLNWLTIIPCLACFDDRVLGRGAKAVRRVLAWGRPPSELEADDDAALESLRHPFVPTVRMLRHNLGSTIATAIFALVVAYKSAPVVENLAKREGQAMNRSFDRFHVVNTYGAFGSVSRERVELVVEGTRDDVAVVGEAAAAWQAYEFRGKPTDPARRSPWLTPRHLRLDWLMWFAGLEAGRTETLAREDWVASLVDRLLNAQPEVLRLLAEDPFGGQAPAYIRVRLARYTFAPLAADRVWEVEDLGLLIQPVAAGDPRLVDYLEQHDMR